MAAQDVRVGIPRIRRALEGPVPLPGPEALTDDQLTAVIADAIADIILFTDGEWKHVLAVAGSDEVTGYPSEWTVDPALSLAEESFVAAQAAYTYFFNLAMMMKVSETVKNEGQEWEWQASATLIRDQIKMLKEQRDAAVTRVVKQVPVLARYASLLVVRDRLAAATLEPWTSGLSRGGMEIG